MALYIIKHLKAPWPKGATVGDIIEFDVLPGWAAGKCELGGSQATVFADPEVSGDGSGAALAPVDPDAAKIAAAMADAAEQERLERARIMAEQKETLAAQGKTIEGLIADVKAGLAESQKLEQQLAAAKVDLEASLAREAKLQEQLATAEQALAAAKAEDKPEAKPKK
ncbi:hypothetical protein [Comamonas testosteroni]|uniref:hypothetical protein n=1 Tax=Comamonas testosteroni TaxID=285 RepID=UPI0026EEF944|nr:hypothetical protein [Comamonas testosteroni]WQD44894.1 hypothetical protein U0024_09070 [Comamonas testosteroni]